MISTLDEKSGEALILRLIASFKAKEKIYRHKHLASAPQNVHIPDEMIKGSEEHSFWLFFSVLTDRRTVSHENYQAHCKLHKKYPELYSEDVVGISPLELYKKINGNKLGMPGQSSRYWPVCAETIFREWNGDPVKMIRELKTVEEVTRFNERKVKGGKLKLLPGYGPKITSLYMLFIAELGLFEYPDDAFPVDVHVQRIFLQTGCVVLDEQSLNDNLEKMLRPFICAVCKKHNIDKVDLSHALWLLGNSLCTGCNKRADAPLLCPIYNSCGGSWNTKNYFIHGYWNPNEIRMRKGGCNILRIADGPLFKI